MPLAVQVAPTWQPSHCMRALDRLKQMLGDEVLPEHELQMALQLAEHLGMVKGTVSSTSSILNISSGHPSSISCFHCLLADVRMAIASELVRCRSLKAGESCRHEPCFFEEIGWGFDDVAGTSAAGHCLATR